MEEENQRIEHEYYLTAWQTALLMNATGNYKTRITPEKLLGKDFGKKKGLKPIDKAEKEERLRKLKEKFGR